jgi:trimeric autotransporter adhesin
MTAPPRFALLGRPISHLPRMLGVALCALFAATTLGACGRSGLLHLGAQVDGSPVGQGDGAVDGQTDGGTHSDGARDGNVGDQPAGDRPPDGSTDRGDTGGDGATDVPPGKVVVALAVAPSLINLAVGGQGTFSATATLSDGTTVDVTAVARWTTDSMAATVQSPGVVRGNFAGTAHITATLGTTLSGQGTVVVMTTIALVSIALDPPIATLPIGGVLDVRVIGTYSDGTTADITAMAKIGDDGTGVVTSNAAGHVTAVRAGAATIFATVGAFQTKMSVVVTPATVVGLVVLPPVGTAGVGTTTGFTASASLSDGTQADVTAAAMWSLDDATVGTIDQRGVATGNAAGKAVVSAAFGGQVGQATFVVTGATLLQVQIDPVDPSVGVGVNLDFTATGLYSDGTKVDLTTQVTWASSAPGVLPIDGAGRAVSRSVGTSVVTATDGPLVATSTVTVTPASLKSIAVTPVTTTLSPGGTIALQAIGTFSDGSMVDLTTSVTWSAAPAGVVSVSNAAATAGVVTAIAVGGAAVTATSGLVTGAAKVFVSAATLQKIVVTPGTTSVPIGASVVLGAQGFFSDGSARDVTAEVAWASADASIATVANAPGTPGSVTGVKAGTVGITATEAGVVGNASVTVVAATLQQILVAPANATLTAGLRANYTATGVYSDGSKVDVTAQVTWTTRDPTIATISNVSGASGLLLARAMGLTTVTATLGGVSGQTSLTVTGATASSLSISPIAVTTPLGTGVQYTATLVFTNGTTRNVTGMATWTSSNPMAATISRTGRATPVAVGTTTIDASYMGLDASTTLTVTDAVATSVQLTPIAPTMPAGTVTQFNATAIFSDGSTRNVTAMATFVSSSPGVVGITTGGRLMRGRATAVGAGSAVITVTYMGFTDMTTVTVTDSVVVSISVSPVGITMPVGTRRQYTATAIRSDGTSMVVTGAATWTSDATNVAAVSTAGGTRGQVTGIGGGTTTIHATYMGIVGGASVTVTPATLSSVQVTPFNPTMSLNATLPFVATAIYSDGTNINVTGMATWQSSDLNVAGISNAAGSRGLATSLSKGSTKISATFQNVMGTTTLAVTDATIMQIQVTPFAPTVPVEFDLPLTATAIYSDGTNRDITSEATWTSSTPATAVVSDAGATKGLVTASAGGSTTIEAQLGSASGSTVVTVSAAMLKSLAIMPANPTIAVGAVQPFTAMGTFDDGSMIDVTTFVTWTSSNLDVGDVSNADGTRGQATAFGVGTTTIQAQRAVITATTSLTVQ